MKEDRLTNREIANYFGLRPSFYVFPGVTALVALQISVDHTTMYVMNNLFELDFKISSNLRYFHLQRI